MPISKKYKIIFIHIPKNAGESIEKTLDMYGGNPEETFWGILNNQIVLQHLTADELKKNYLKTSLWNDYFKFAVVRNPWSKAVSEYHWYLKFGPHLQFHEWVDTLNYRIKLNNSININEIGHNIEQFRFIFDKNENLLVDKILRFENINFEFNQLCSKKNWNFNLIKSQSTASIYKDDFQLFYDLKSLKTISNIYKKDIDLFDYNEDETFKNYKITSKPYLIDLNNINKKKIKSKLKYKILNKLNFFKN